MYSLLELYHQLTFDLSGEKNNNVWKGLKKDNQCAFDKHSSSNYILRPNEQIISFSFL